MIDAPYADLVARLRKLAVDFVEPNSYTEAADAIEALTKEAHRRETRALSQAQEWRARAKAAEAALARARDDALEDAAKIADEFANAGYLNVAAAIRARKTG